MDTAEVLFETVIANCRDIPLYQVVFPVNADPLVIVDEITRLAVAEQLRNVLSHRK